MSIENQMPTPRWASDTTEVTINHADGSTTTVQLSSIEAVSLLQHTIAEKIRLGDTALTRISLDLSTRE